MRYQLHNAQIHLEVHFFCRSAQ